MRKAFNIAIAALVAWILWMACCGRPSGKAEGYSAVAPAPLVDPASRTATSQSHFGRPVSVARDLRSDVLYVSCLGDSAAMEPAMVCRADIFGEIIDTLPIGPLCQPRCAKPFAGRLYITDMSRVIRFDLQADTISRVCAIPKAKSLRGAEADAAGNIFVSDPEAGCIYKISRDSASVFCRDSLCRGVAGLCFDGKNLVAAAGNLVLRLSEDGRPDVFATMPFKACGIRCGNEGSYLVSDLQGNIHRVSKNGASMIYKAAPGAQGADFEYIPEQRMIYMPACRENRLVLFQECDTISKP